MTCTACGTVWHERGVSLNQISSELKEIVRERVFAEREESDSVVHDLKQQKLIPEAKHQLIVEDVIGNEPFLTVSDRTSHHQPRQDVIVVKAPQAPPVGPVGEETVRLARSVSRLIKGLGREGNWPTVSSLASRIGQQCLPEDWTAQLAVRNATDKVRNRIRWKSRNRLTPFRRAMWTVWMMILAALVVVICDRDLMERMWPKTAHLYEAVIGKRPPLADFQLRELSTRYAESIEGPVLEIRGVVVNAGGAEALPFMQIMIDGTPLGGGQGAALSETPIPNLGERPFLVRAMLPQNAQLAEIYLQAKVNTASGDDTGFIMQRQGSGWGGSDLPGVLINEEMTGKTELRN